MNKNQFRYELARAGYSCDRIKEAESILRRLSMLPQHPDELRQAAHDYLLICTDVSKLIGFLRSVNYLNRSYAISFGEASDFVRNVVCGWCH